VRSTARLLRRRIRYTRRISNPVTLSIMSYAPFIKEIGRGPKGSKPLTIDQAEALFGDMMDGRVPDLELGAIILSMRIKAESPDELLGFQRALDARTAHVAVPPGPRLVVLPTYNGARRQANLMPLLALLLAREGIPVLIQGRHDFHEQESAVHRHQRLPRHRQRPVRLRQRRRRLGGGTGQTRLRGGQDAGQEGHPRGHDQGHRRPDQEREEGR
jgi:hypothetical protein